MKKRFKLLFIVGSLILSGLNWSCSSEKIDIDNPAIEDSPGKPSFPSTDVIYPYETYVGGVSGEMHEALKIALTNPTGAVSPNTRLLILGSLSEIDFSTLEEAYKNGAVIAVENPQKTDFEAFFNAHPDWYGYMKGTPLDHLLLYSFDNEDCISIINKDLNIDFSLLDYDNEIEEEEIDPVLLIGEEIIPTFENPVPAYYTQLKGWFGHLIEDEISDLDGESESTFENFAAGQHLTANFKFVLDPVVRKIIGSKADEILDAKPEITINLDAHQIHVYEGSESQGNYYIMYATTTFSSASAYKGLFHNKHGGVHVRGVGFSAKKLNITFELLDSLERPVTVMFPGSGAPLPGNENNSVNYSRNSSFSVGSSLSVSGGIDKDGPHADAKGSVQLGWTWSKQVSADIKNVNISPINAGSKAGWSLSFENLPYYDTGIKTYWINEGQNTNSRNSQILQSAWVWYEPDAKDDDNQPPYKIKLHMDGEYEAASFISTKADWKAVRKPIISEFIKKNGKDTPVLGKDTVISLTRGVETRTVGKILIKNNFTDKYINKIRVFDGDSTKTNYYEKIASYAPGQSIDLGYFFIKNKKKKKINYGVEINVKDPNSDNDGEYYQYYLVGENSFNLVKGEERTLNAPNDFRKNQ